MDNQSRSWSDQQIEGIIGDLLLAGVVFSGAIVLIGGIVYLIHQGSTMPHYGVFHGEPSDLRSVGGIVGDALARHGRGIVQLGLLFLIATPVARVAFSIFAFAVQRDWLYVVVTLIVLAVLIFSLTGGQA
jgi:uncharacterized membrane protein